MSKMKLILAAILIFFHCTSALGIELVEGVSGYKAELPCYLTPPDPEDRAILALWYKQGRRLPVYSFDARASADRHQTDREVFGDRATFVSSNSASGLVLQPVTVKDAGVYTCRVDYMTSPTHNTVVNLTVIEPPGKMTIYDHKGQVIEGRTPPVSEGSPLHLSCVVIGGNPVPGIRWWSKNHSHHYSTDVINSGNIQADLTIPEVTRSFYNSEYICEAKNNNQQPPITKTIIIDMNLRPLSATIKVPRDPLIAGVQYTITCEAKGSKPAAAIKWFLDGEEIDSVHTHTTASAAEVTLGIVNIVPKERDNTKTLKCLAISPAIEGSEVFQVATLNVHYSPVVSLTLGPSLNPSEIKQGDDVYFECHVKANPKPYKVTWFKDGLEIHQNVSSGVLVTEKSLVLQKVHRSSAGEFKCQASNSQGTETSNPVNLDIMFPPECLMDQPAVLAVGRGETINITCRVASNPLKATFHWQLNGSERSYSSPGISSSTGGGLERPHSIPGALSPRGHLTSKYTFVGTLDKDYGSLLCWANNSVGMQENGCVFNIIPAGPPSSPELCEILNHTAENIEVACNRGFDGGLSQAFLAEVYDEGGALHLNVTSEEPLFSVNSLNSGTTYVIRVRAYNSKGRSAPVSLTAYTLKVAEKRMGETQSLIYSPLILIFMGILAGFLLIIVVLVLVARWRKTLSSASPGVAKTPPDSTQIPPTKEAQTPISPSNRDTGDDDAFTTLSRNIEIVAVNKAKKRVLVVENGKVERPGQSTPETPAPPDALDGAVAAGPRVSPVKPSVRGPSSYLPPSYVEYPSFVRSYEEGSSFPSTGDFLRRSMRAYYAQTLSPQTLEFQRLLSREATLRPECSPPLLCRDASLRPEYSPSLLSREAFLRHECSPPLLSREASIRPEYSPPLLSREATLRPEYSPSYPTHYSTPPRKRSPLYEVESSNSGLEAQMEWKGNPKYLIRTRDKENNDESFV